MALTCHLLTFEHINYFRRDSDRVARDWDDVPEEIKKTFDRLGVPEAERKYLAGSSAQYESEVVYHNMRKDFDNLGIVFMDTDSAVQEYPELVKKYFGKLIPPADNKMAALNSAVWSGGPLSMYQRVLKSQCRSKVISGSTRVIQGSLNEL